MVWGSRTKACIIVFLAFGCSILIIVGIRRVAFVRGLL